MLVVDWLAAFAFGQTGAMGSDLEQGFLETAPAAAHVVQALLDSFAGGKSKDFAGSCGQLARHPFNERLLDVQRHGPAVAGLRIVAEAARP